MDDCKIVEVKIYIYIYITSFLGATTPIGPGPFRCQGFTHTHTHTHAHTHSVGLLCTRDQPDAETANLQYTILISDKFLGWIRTCSHSNRGAADPRL
jgi:hypothetical protein